MRLDLDGAYEIIVLHDQARTEPRTFLVQTNFRQFSESAFARNDDICTAHYSQIQSLIG